jgi:uncharacterized membrane protein YeaQ/YmgE (transglycosylase-associated protein family)
MRANATPLASFRMVGFLHGAGGVHASAGPRSLKGGGRTGRVISAIAGVIGAIVAVVILTLCALKRRRFC